MEMNTKRSLSENVETGATGIHYFKNDEVMEITTADSKLMTVLRRLAKQDDRVTIDQEPNVDNGGFMLALLPTEYIYGMHKKKTVVLSEERKEKLREQMKRAREQKNSHI